MKKKNIRIAVIAAIIILFFAGIIIDLKVESADSVPQKPENSLAAKLDKEAGKEKDESADGSDSDKTDEKADDENKENDDKNSDTDGKVAAETPGGGEIIKSEDTSTANSGVNEDGVKYEEETVAGPDGQHGMFPVQTGPPVETDPNAVHYCTVEIRCDTLTDHSKVDNEAIIPYIPDDGVILAKTSVQFEYGENVFDVLKRATRTYDIQMEFRNDSMYSGAYIEGINYLYEFDGGTLSGWMYKVNGQFPNYGCSKYYVRDNDEIVWMYTCDLGRDVGDNSVW